MVKEGVVSMPPKRTFTEEEAEDLRKQYAMGNISIRQLAKNNYVDPLTIQRVLHKKGAYDNSYNARKEREEAQKLRTKQQLQKRLTKHEILEYKKHLENCTKKHVPVKKIRLCNTALYYMRKCESSIRERK